MEGRTILTCADCGRTREVVGELPEEYGRSFGQAVREEGWVVRPAAAPALLCGDCLRRYEGSETRDDAAKL